jgi:hypothetical protein
MRVTEVWFLKKKDKGNGFEGFHYDYKNIEGGSNDVSFTANVNLGKLNEANDIATLSILPSNGNHLYCQDQGGRRWCKNYLYKKKKRSINYQKKIYIVSSQE